MGDAESSRPSVLPAALTSTAPGPGKGRGGLTLKMCLVQLRAETSKPNVAGAVRAKEVNSDPRAMRDEEEILVLRHFC